eukprot:6214420-Pleurochrysis_carterae.AAC.1
MGADVLAGARLRRLVQRGWYAQAESRPTMPGHRCHVGGYIGRGTQQSPRGAVDGVEDGIVQRGVVLKEPPETGERRGRSSSDGAAGE